MQTVVQLDVSTNARFSGSAPVVDSHTVSVQNLLALPLRAATVFMDALHIAPLRRVQLTVKSLLLSFCVSLCCVTLEIFTADIMFMILMFRILIVNRKLP